MPVIKTLDDIINREDRYDINKVAFYTMTDDKSLVILDKTLFEVYMRYAIPYIGTYSVSEKERRYYRYRPHLLSLDFYGTPSLSWLVMLLNDRECPSKFYLKQTIKMIPSEHIGTVFDVIATKSSKRLAANWTKYRRLVGEDIENV